MGPCPDLADLATLPPGSLGHRYAHLLADQGLDPLAPPLLTKDADAEATFLQRRIRYTHDVWHTIAGCPTTLAGEAAMNSLTTEQLRWSGSALLIAADLIHRVHDDLEPEGPTGVDVGRAIAYGLGLGASTSAPLLAQRWEEGWERPLEDWREQLGAENWWGATPSPLSRACEAQLTWITTGRTERPAEAARTTSQNRFRSLPAPADHRRNP